MAKYLVCPDCEGEGKTLCDSLKGEVIDQEAMEDPDFRESYFGGDYDVICKTCDGKRVITKEQLEKFESDAQYRAEVMAEVRMGA